MEGMYLLLLTLLFHSLARTSNGFVENQRIYSEKILPGNQETPDRCTDKPCKNGGTCNLEIEKPTCTCTDEYTGDDCGTKKDRCTDKPCKNGGTCNLEIEKPTCTCTDEYTGDDCGTKKDRCTDKPCKNGGTCNLEIEKP
ncbi:delta-like protein C, partial [Uloborus diversus]|uniref:delta-like protein C n=1 Tax=Uloborus diversus TaxID=327109 RepID=UPI0024094A13